MLYQLPNGRVLYLSIEEYLAISDEELMYLSATQVGEIPPPQFFFNPDVTPTPDSTTRTGQDEMDYTPDSEESAKRGPFYIQDMPDDIIT